ncbi:hypothetical protein BGZ99_004320 [Dissophora globulifera]|uniref:Uncharacterized protein n=1 Tax=Dissophora globulifera TaxID=979702 RepID=A0A9P6RT04_9FUNG|nr:hypothetical protein BGZ99_004320 [Dissophora globulifera]
MAASSSHSQHQHYQESDATSDSNDEFASASEGDDDLPWEPVVRSSPIIARQSSLQQATHHSVQHQQQLETPRPAPAALAHGHAIDVSSGSKLQQEHEDDDHHHHQQHSNQPSYHLHQHQYRDEHQQQYDHDQSQLQPQGAFAYNQPYSSSSSFSPTATTQSSYSHSHSQLHSHTSHSHQQLQHHTSTTSFTTSSSTSSPTLSRSQLGSNQPVSRGATPKLRERMRQSPVLHSKVVQAYLDPNSAVSSTPSTRRQQITPEYVRQAWMQDHEDAQQESSEDDLQYEEEEPTQYQSASARDLTSRDPWSSVPVMPIDTTTNTGAAPSSSSSEFSSQIYYHQQQQQEGEYSQGIDEQLNVAYTPEIEHTTAIATSVPLSASTFSPQDYQEEETSWGFDDQLDIDQQQQQNQNHPFLPLSPDNRAAVGTSPQADQQQQQDEEESWKFDDRIVVDNPTAEQMESSWGFDEQLELENPVVATQADDADDAPIPKDGDHSYGHHVQMDEDEGDAWVYDDQLMHIEDSADQEVPSATETLDDHDDVQRVSIGNDHEREAESDEIASDSGNPFASPEDDLVAEQELLAHSSSTASELDHHHSPIEYQPAHQSYRGASPESHVHSTEDFEHGTNAGGDVEVAEAEASWGFDMDEVLDIEVQAIEQEEEGEEMEQSHYHGSSTPENSTKDAILEHDVPVVDLVADTQDDQLAQESDNEHDVEVRDVLRSAQANPIVESGDGHKTGASSSPLSLAVDDQDYAPAGGIDHIEGGSSFHHLQPTSLPQFIEADSVDNEPSIAQSAEPAALGARSDSEDSDIYGDLSTAREMMSRSSNRLDEAQEDDDFLEHMERGVPMNRSISTPYSDDEPPKFVMDDEVVELMERGEPRPVPGTPAMLIESLDDIENDAEDEGQEAETDVVADYGLDTPFHPISERQSGDLSDDLAISSPSHTETIHEEVLSEKEIDEIVTAVAPAAVEQKDQVDGSERIEDHILSSDVPESDFMTTTEPVQEVAQEAIVDMVSDDRDPANPFSDAAAIDNPDAWDQTEQSIDAAAIESAMELAASKSPDLDTVESSILDSNEPVEPVHEIEVDVALDEDAWASQDMDTGIAPIILEAPIKDSVTDMFHADLEEDAGHKADIYSQHAVDEHHDVPQDVLVDQDSQNFADSLFNRTIEEPDLPAVMTHHHGYSLADEESVAELEQPQLHVAHTDRNHGSTLDAIDISVDEDDAWGEQEEDLDVNAAVLTHFDPVPVEVHEDKTEHEEPLAHEPLAQETLAPEPLAQEPLADANEPSGLLALQEDGQPPALNLIQSSVDVVEEEPEIKADLDDAIEAALEEDAWADQAEDIPYSFTPHVAKETQQEQESAAVAEILLGQSDNSLATSPLEIHHHHQQQETRDIFHKSTNSYMDNMEPEDDDAWGGEDDIVIEDVEEAPSRIELFNASEAQLSDRVEEHAHTSKETTIYDAVDIAIEDDMWGGQGIDIDSVMDLYGAKDTNSMFEERAGDVIPFATTERAQEHEVEDDIPFATTGVTQEQREVEAAAEVYIDAARDEYSWAQESEQTSKDHLWSIAAPSAVKMDHEQIADQAASTYAELLLDAALEDDTSVEQAHSITPVSAEAPAVVAETTADYDSFLDELEREQQLSVTSTRAEDILPLRDTKQMEDVPEDAWGWDEDETAGDLSAENEETLMEKREQPSKNLTYTGHDQLVPEQDIRKDEDTTPTAAETGLSALESEQGTVALTNIAVSGISNAATPDRLSPLTASKERTMSDADSGEEGSSRSPSWQDVSPASVSKRSEAGMSVGSEFESEYSVRSMDEYGHDSPLPEQHEVTHGHGYGLGHDQVHHDQQHQSQHGHDHGSGGSISTEPKHHLGSAMSWTDLNQDDDWNDEMPEVAIEETGTEEIVTAPSSSSTATVAPPALELPDLPDLGGADSWDFDQDEDSGYDNIHLQQKGDAPAAIDARTSLTTPDMSAHQRGFGSSATTPSPNYNATMASYHSSDAELPPTSSFSPTQIHRAAMTPTVMTQTTLPTTEVEDDSHLPLAIRQQRARLAAKGKPLPPISKYKSTKDVSSSPAASSPSTSGLSPRLAATSPRISFTAPAGITTPASPLLGTATLAGSSMSPSMTTPRTTAAVDHKYLTPALQKQRERLEKKRAEAAAAAALKSNTTRRLTVTDSEAPDMQSILGGRIGSPQIAQATLPPSALRHPTTPVTSVATAATTTTIMSPTLSQKRTVHMSDTVTTKSIPASPSLSHSSPKDESPSASRRRGSSGAMHASISSTAPSSSSSVAETGGFMRRSKESHQHKMGSSTRLDSHGQDMDTDVVARSSQSDAYRYSATRVSTSSSRSGWNDTVDEEDHQEEAASNRSGPFGSSKTMASTPKETQKPSFMSGSSSASSSFYQQAVPGLDSDHHDGDGGNRYGSSSAGFGSGPASDSVSGRGSASMSELLGSGSTSSYLSSKKADEYDPYGPMSSASVNTSGSGKLSSKGGKGKARSSMEDDTRSSFSEHNETLIGQTTPTPSMSLLSPTSAVSMSHRHDHHYQSNASTGSLVGDISSMLNEKKSSGLDSLGQDRADTKRSPASMTPPTSSSNLQKSSSWSFGSWVSSAVAAASDTIDKAYETLDPEYSKMKTRGGSVHSDASGMVDENDPRGMDPYRKPGYVVGGSSLALGLASISTTGSSQQQQSQQRH